MDFGSVDVLVWLACAYALLLLAVAYAFDVAARALVGRTVIGHDRPTEPPGVPKGAPPDEPAPWPATEAERFHRGIACAVVVVAVVWPAIMLVTADSSIEVVLLAGTIAVVGIASWPLWRHLRRTPAGFPEERHRHSEGDALDTRLDLRKG